MHRDIAGTADPQVRRTLVKSSCGTCNVLIYSDHRGDRCMAVKVAYLAPKYTVAFLG